MTKTLSLPYRQGDCLSMDELYKIRKNYGIYMGKEMER